MIYRVSIKSFPDYKPLLQENYVEYKHNFLPLFNLLAPEFYIEILAHPVCKMWIIQKPKKVALWNKRHFEEKNEECAACLKYSVVIFVKIYIYIYM